MRGGVLFLVPTLRRPVSERGYHRLLPEGRPGALRGLRHIHAEPIGMRMIQIIIL